MRLLRAWSTYEARTWAGLWLWLTRRRDGVGVGGDGGARGFGYAGAQASTVYGLVFVCVVETVGMSLWTASMGMPVLHWTVLVLDVYTVLLALGYHAAGVARPHTVGPEGLRVRHGALLDVRIPAGLVADVRRELRFPAGSTVPDDVLDVPVAAQTSLTVELAAPVAVTRLLGRPREVRTVRCHADDPHALVAAVRELIAHDADDADGLTPGRTTPCPGPGRPR
ncbi:hypothetical protein [Streptomyces sp. UNOC14_S4]|uniref:hypothetical protein n=1 Tax=Streptomyces sp. UNOC14_S4 TaxID=2872340 RepID=UPI001E306CEB|nr:hypothetical protein [Streptomyces sp. UNOC14_S4]MCC3772504.1 hypothetical protein [Streptomyces sp. UNOC14_S4]